MYRYRNPEIVSGDKSCHLQSLDCLLALKYDAKAFRHFQVCRKQGYTVNSTPPKPETTRRIL